MTLCHGSYEAEYTTDTLTRPLNQGPYGPKRVLFLPVTDHVTEAVTEELNNLNRKDTHHVE